MDWRRLFLPALTPAEIRHSPVVLRPVHASDYPAWVEAMARDAPHFRPVQPTWPKDHLTRDAYDRRLRFYHREWRRQTGFAFHLFGEADDAFVGSLRLASVQFGASRTASLGYWIAQPRWGEGFASAAVEAALDFAFGALGLARVEAHCLPFNGASLRVLEKSGFSKEGVLVDFLEIDGIRQDHWVFGKTARFLQGEGE